jgi:hypothetical protein
MKTPAQRHFEEVSAQLAAAAAAADGGHSMAGSSAYELMLAKLHTDRRRLKSIQSVERKVDVKREVLPDYAEYVNGVLAGGRGVQDEVLVTVMVWRIDAGDFPGALAIAAYCLEHGLKMPDQYDRTLATVLAEEVADRALDALKVDQVFDPQLLLEVAKLTDQHDMHDQVRAKLYKAIGYALQNDPATALPYLERALQLFDRIGVKKDIARLQQQLDGGEKDPATP